MLVLPIRFLRKKNRKTNYWVLKENSPCTVNYISWPAVKLSKNLRNAQPLGHCRVLSFSKLPTPAGLWAFSAPLHAGQGRSDPRATALQCPPAPGEKTLCPHLGQQRWEESSPHE